MKLTILAFHLIIDLFIHPSFIFILFSFSLGAEDIGTWQNVFDLICTSSVITNAAMIVFTMKLVDQYTEFTQFWIFIGFQWVMFGLQLFIRAAIPDTPFEVTIQKKRSDYLNRKLILREIDDDIEDNEEEGGGDDTATQHHHHSTSNAVVSTKNMSQRELTEYINNMIQSDVTSVIKNNTGVGNSHATVRSNQNHNNSMSISRSNNHSRAEEENEEVDQGSVDGEIDENAPFSGRI